MKNYINCTCYFEIQNEICNSMSYTEGEDGFQPMEEHVLPKTVKTNQELRRGVSVVGPTFLVVPEPVGQLASWSSSNFIERHNKQ